MNSKLQNGTEVIILGADNNNDVWLPMICLLCQNVCNTGDTLQCYNEDKLYCIMVMPHQIALESREKKTTQCL